MNDVSNSSGGTIIIRPERMSYVPLGDQKHIGPWLHRLFLTSDWHLGAASSRMDKIAEDLLEADYEDARILINGDTFDAIVVGDKRHDPSEVHPRLRHTKDMINGVLDWAEELLAPYVDRVDLIGIGNHEDTIIKRGGFNMGLELVRRLNKHGGKVHYGGWTGFIDYRFTMPKNNTRRFVIHYHHGSTKSNSTKATLTSLENKKWAEADLYWVGHSHAKVHSSSMRYVVPMQGSEMIEKEIHFVSTPGYLRIISGQEGSDGSKSRKRNYAADAAYVPGGMGGAWVNIHHLPKRDKIEVVL